MSKQFKDVITFIKEVRQVELPTKFRKLLKDEALDRENYMHEELREFHYAVEEHDAFSQLDAMIDLVYFAYGTAAHMGVTPDQWDAAWDQVHKANMKKKAGVKEGREVKGVDATKPEGWQEPDFSYIFKHIF